MEPVQVVGLLLLFANILVLLVCGGMFIFFLNRYKPSPPPVISKRFTYSWLTFSRWLSGIIGALMTAYSLEIMPVSCLVVFYIWRYTPYMGIVICIQCAAYYWTYQYHAYMFGKTTDTNTQTSESHEKSVYSRIKSFVFPDVQNRHKNGYILFLFVVSHVLLATLPTASMIDEITTDSLEDVCTSFPSYLGKIIEAIFALVIAVIFFFKMRHKVKDVLFLKKEFGYQAIFGFPLGLGGMGLTVAGFPKYGACLLLTAWLAVNILSFAVPSYLAFVWVRRNVVPKSSDAVDLSESLPRASTSRQLLCYDPKTTKFSSFALKVMNLDVKTREDWVNRICKELVLPPTASNSYSCWKTFRDMLKDLLDPPDQVHPITKAAKLHRFRWHYLLEDSLYATGILTSQHTELADLFQVVDTINSSATSENTLEELQQLDIDRDLINAVISIIEDHLTKLIFDPLADSQLAKVFNTEIALNGI